MVFFFGLKVASAYFAETPHGIYPQPKTGGPRQKQNEESSSSWRTGPAYETFTQGTLVFGRAGAYVSLAGPEAPFSFTRSLTLPSFGGEGRHVSSHRFVFRRD